MQEIPTLKHMRDAFEQKCVVDFLEDAYGIGNSKGTKEAYRYALYAFNRFCIKIYEKNLVELISDLKNKPMDSSIQVFVEFKRYLDKKITKFDNPLSNHTKRVYFTILKKFFRTNGIKISQEDISDNIRIGRRMRVQKYALDHATVAKIIGAMNSFEFKTLSTLLASTGMRVMEAIKLQPSDFDFNSFPVPVYIKASHTKTNEARTVYLTTECVGMIEQLINNKQSEQPYLFGKSTSADQVYETYQKAFRRVMHKLGLYKILDNGINQITIHSFRQFFRTYAGHHINRDYADSFIGHRFYLSEYENMPEEERKKIFLQLEPHMTLTGSKVQKHPKDPEVSVLQDQLAQLQEKIRILGIKYLQQT